MVQIRSPGIFSVLLVASGASADRPAAWGDGGDADNRPLRIDHVGMAPRILLMAGCSGSTFVQRTARHILSAHGVMTGGSFEIFDACIHWPGNGSPACENQHNFWLETTGQTLVQAHANFAGSLEKAVERLRSSNTVFMSKADMSVIASDNPTRQSLVRLNAKVAAVLRDNALDRAVCMVRDCFQTEEKACGISVDETGEKSDLCFDRRKSPNHHIKAKFDPVCLKAKLEGDGVPGVGFDRHLEAIMEVAPTNFCKPIRYEDLAEFQATHSEEQYGNVSETLNNRGMERSMLAWSNLLLCWGYTPIASRISEVLQRSALSRSPESPHGTTIFNIDEVAQVLATSSNSVVRGLVRLSEAQRPKLE